MIFANFQIGAVFIFSVKVCLFFPFPFVSKSLKSGAKNDFWYNKHDIDTTKSSSFIANCSLNIDERACERKLGILFMQTFYRACLTDPNYVLSL